METLSGSPGFPDLRVERVDGSGSPRKIRWGDPEPYFEVAVDEFPRLEFGGLIRGRYLGYSERAIENFVIRTRGFAIAREAFLRRPAWADGPLFSSRMFRTDPSRPPRGSHLILGPTVSRAPGA